MTNLSHNFLAESAIEKIGRLLSENYGIKVIFKANQHPCTDGKKIFLPVIGNDADQYFLDAVAGMIDHESSHVLHSDFTIIKEILKEQNSEKLKSLANIIEDARVDEAIIQKWRGCRVNINKLNEWCFSSMEPNWNSISPWGKFIQMCGAVLCLDADHYFTKKMSQEDANIWKYVEQIKHLLLKSKTLQNTEESVALAKEVLKQIHDFSDLCKEFHIKVKGDLIESDEEPEDVSECFTSNFEYTKKQQKKDSELSDKGKLIQKHAQKTKEQGKNSYLVYTTENDEIDLIKDGSQQDAGRLLENSRHITHVLRSKMMRNLLAQAKVQREPNKERGKIDHRHLYRLAIGTSKKVFYQQTDALGFNTRASLWVDHSGSMQGSKLDLAASSAMLFGEVLSQLKIPFEVCGFSSSTNSWEGHNIFEKASKIDKETYIRWGGVWVGVYKSFDEPWNLVKHRCASMRRNQRDNTYDGECLKLAAKRLLQYPELRRILFWFNDGEPCPNISSFSNQHKDYLLEITKEVEKVIEVFAVGITTDAVKQFFTNSVVVNQLEDLPKVIMGELDRMLRQNQREYLKAA